MNDAVQLLNALQSLHVDTLCVWDKDTQSWVDASTRWTRLQVNDSVCINAQWAQSAVSRLALPSGRAQTLLADLSRCSASIRRFGLERNIVVAEWTLT